jgi:hypothetical protein
MANHEITCRGCGEDLRVIDPMNSHEANCLARKLDTCSVGLVHAKERIELLEGMIEAAKRHGKEQESRLDTYKAALEAIRDGVPGPRLLATDTLNGVMVVERRCPKEGCPYVDGPDFSIGNPCRCE